MELKRIFILICVFNTALGFAQRDTREIINAENIERININSDEVYLINIVASDKDQIMISTHSEGEYYNEIALETSINNKGLIINTSYPRKLTSGYDKLSAHKVFSLEIQLHIPEGMEVNVKSNIANLQGKGNFRSLFAELKQGYCKLIDFSGTAVINTFTGNIFVETKAGILQAKSRNGKVEIPDFIPAGNPITLTSIDGDIKVRKN